jgi:hypothetical protein
VGMSALHLSARCLLEALGRAFMCFQFRHKSSEQGFAITSLKISN